MTVITATITSRLTGEISDVVVNIPVSSDQLLAFSLALLLLSVFFLFVQRFELWALTMVVIVSIMNVPFALTGMVSYWLVFAALGYFLATVLKFLSHDLGKVLGGK